MTSRIAMASGVTAALIALSAAAADGRETLSIGRSTPDPHLIQEFLFPEAKCEDPAWQCMSVKPSSDRAVGLEVRFPTNSAELTPAARAQLEPLGKVLASRGGKLNPGEIVIEGHTDARGPKGLNDRLSKDRAESVVKYLVSTYNVERTALVPVGRGKDELRDSSHPDSEVNRRVEMVRKAK
jgi:outer membrane protein OmpA-like peptidoglycan-associated protein